MAEGNTKGFSRKDLKNRWLLKAYQDTQRNAFWLVLSNQKPPKSIPLGVLVEGNGVSSKDFLQMAKMQSKSLQEHRKIFGAETFQDTQQKCII